MTTTAASREHIDSIVGLLIIRTVFNGRVNENTYVKVYDRLFKNYLRSLGHTLHERMILKKAHNVRA